MRTIKLRVFDKLNNKFCYFDISKSSEADLEGLGIFRNIEKQQYTGLKDCKGIEIYEGDIVKAKWGVEKVRWGFDVLDNDSFWCGFGLSEKPEKYEVIGNIYQDKNLLTKNK